MSHVRMNIQSIVVGGGPMTSLVILKPAKSADGKAVQLPIRIGRVEAAAISMGVEDAPHNRPMTHDLLNDVLQRLGARLSSVLIADVRGTTFYALLQVLSADGEPVSIDARPSDAIALAVRAHVPIYADETVLATASMPDFGAVEKDEREREAAAFHDFVEGLSPEDFATEMPEATEAPDEGE